MYICLGLIIAFSLSPHLWVFGLYTASDALILTLFVWVYMKITPYDEHNLIANGKVAPAIVLAGGMLGFAFPILTVSWNSSGFSEYALWSLVAGFTQIICFKILYRFMPKQIEADNVAAAIFYAAASLCAGLIIAFSLVP